MHYPPQIIDHAEDGILQNMQFAVKDIIQVNGYPTSGGNPLWGEIFGDSSRPTAEIVQKLLDAGAECAGKTKTDELAFNHIGENAHYGSPINPKAPSRFCGGSSSGSAAAVSGALVEFALGTDTGGSIRGPASFCGIWGLRPTHGRISTDGVMPLAPSYDCVGWFARNPEIMEKVGSVLLGTDQVAIDHKPKLLCAVDIIDMMERRFGKQIEKFISKVKDEFAPVEDVSLMGELDFEKDWFECFRLSQAGEIWKTHQDWIIEHQPSFGDGVYERFEMASQLDENEVENANKKRPILAEHIHSLLKDGNILILPSTMTTAFSRAMDAEQRLKTRLPHVGLMAFSGLAGTPQLSMPLTQVDGSPLGISIMGPKGSDVALLALGHRLSLSTGVVY